MAKIEIPDGQDFGYPVEFGFHGSAGLQKDMRTGHLSEPGKTGGETKAPMTPYARGGRAEMPAHMHPAGHRIVETEAHPTGGVVMKHAHGGYTHMRPDGNVTHHNADGTPAMGMGGGGAGEGTYVDRMAKGGHMEAGEERADMMQDKGLIKKAMRQHETAEHGGEHHALKLADGGDVDGDDYARGGRVGKTARLPHGMTPVAGRPKSPINTPPRKPETTTTPQNAMPGGVMAYGVQPSDEPEVAGSTQGIPQFRAKGGKVRC